MALNHDDAAQRAAYWPVPIARAVPAAAFAIVVTFSADHSGRFGLVSFGIFALVSGIVLALVARVRLSGTTTPRLFVGQGVISVVTGALALLALLSSTGGARYLLPIVAIYALLSGVLELYCGVRSRRQFVASSDWIAVGAFTFLAGLVFLLIPPGYSDTFTGPDKITRTIDAAVTGVGFLGAYAAIVAVYLLIAGFSAKWGPQASAAEPAGTTSDSHPTTVQESGNKA